MKLTLFGTLNWLMAAVSAQANLRSRLSAAAVAKTSSLNGVAGMIRPLFGTLNWLMAAVSAQANLRSRLSAAAVAKNPQLNRICFYLLLACQAGHNGNLSVPSPLPEALA
ncbi:hypothetical protein [Methylobacillus flagellatus]|uniref:hypothetical protein n=1 Tax=Methylobacillus flagellatus TaxID=405 RepID=UPI0010F7CA51|nr:hypothetical protein [Methylobacillus flagellatus]